MQWSGCRQQQSVVVAGRSVVCGARRGRAAAAADADDAAVAAAVGGLIVQVDAGNWVKPARRPLRDVTGTTARRTMWHYGDWHHCGDAAVRWTNLIKVKKGQRYEDLYSAPSWEPQKRPGMDHTVFTLLTHHTCLYLESVHQAAPPLLVPTAIWLQLTTHLSTPWGWKAELASWQVDGPSQSYH